MQLTLNRKGPLSMQGEPMTIKDTKSSITSMNYEHSGNSLAVTTFDGFVKIYNTNTGRLQTVLNAHSSAGENESLTFTSVKWKPEWAGNQRRVSRVLIATASNGLVMRYDLSGRDSYRVDNTQKELGNSL